MAEKYYNTSLIIMTNSTYSWMELLDEEFVTVVVSSDFTINIYDNVNVIVMVTQLEHSDIFDKAYNYRLRDDDVMLKSIEDVSIPVPKYFFPKIKTYARVLSKLDYNIKYMLKPILQARSLGQVIIDYDIYKEMADYMSHDGADWSEFNRKFNIDVSTARDEQERRKAFDHISMHAYYVSELVDFKEEYRVIYVKGVDPCDYIIEKRTGYQVNSKEPRCHEPYYLNLKD